MIELVQLISTQAPERVEPGWAIHGWSRCFSAVDKRPPATILRHFTIHSSELPSHRSQVKVVYARFSTGIGCEHICT